MRCGRRLVVVLALLASCSSGDGDDDRASRSTTTEPAVSTTSAAAAPTTTTTTATTVPLAADTPAALAAQIEQAETAIRTGDPSLGHLQQVAYRALAARPEWDDEVEALVPASLRATVEANVAAGRELRSLVRTPRPNLPAWRIVAPEPADVLRGHYEAAEAEFGVPWQYLAAVHLTETRMGRIRGTSTAGAQGPMQFLPATWETYGEGDINDTGDAIRAAARYLQANGAPERMADALYRYNPTPKYVNAVTAYAEQMAADEHTYEGYWHWEVYYWSTLGDVWLPVGYERTEEAPVTEADVPVARTGS